MIATQMKNELLTLTEAAGSPCISLYAPMEMNGRETTQNPVRVKNLIREAQRGLEQMGVSQQEADALIAPLERLLHDNMFWQHQQHGFAAFVSPHKFEHFKVPVLVPEQVSVSKRFHMKPLLPLLTQNGRFFVLALSQHKVRLLDCTLGGNHQLTLPEEVPENIEEVRRWEDAGGVTSRSGQMTDRRNSRISGGQGGHPVGSSHGMGITNDALHEYRLRFFREVNDGLQSLFTGEKIPLVLVGVEDIIHEFRGMFEYPNVLEDFISGNFDELSNNELHAKALPIAESFFRKGEEEALARYNPALAHQLATSDVDQILPAAFDGRVGTLFVATDRNVWGRYNNTDRIAERLHTDHPDAQDLLDLAAFQALNTGAEVYAVESARLPDPGGNLAAIFRY
jgi:hypothetical protein